MASYTIRAIDGPTRVQNRAGNGDIFHHFEFNPNGTITSGGVIIQARRPGAPESVLDTVGTYMFTGPTHINYVGPVSEWVFTVNSFMGSASQIHITVTSTSTGKADGEGIDPADKAKLDAITDTGSGMIITDPERSKVAALPFITEEDLLLEGLAFGQIYAKTAQVG
tara:strand:+ start:2357 stop:2857 length:501 start_codon:yes stop_codon:yes gene_type:complete